MRSGSLNGFLREVGRADLSDTEGEKWKGRASKWGQLPVNMVVHPQYIPYYNIVVSIFFSIIPINPYVTPI